MAFDEKAQLSSPCDVDWSVVCDGLDVSEVVRESDTLFGGWRLAWGVVSGIDSIAVRNVDVLWSLSEWQRPIMIILDRDAPC